MRSDSMPTFTKAQLDVLYVIKEFSSRFGMPPTMSEIAETMHYKSENASRTHVSALIKKGALNRRDGLARGLSVTDIGSSAVQNHKFEPTLVERKPKQQRMLSPDDPNYQLLQQCALWGLSPAEMIRARELGSVDCYKWQKGQSARRQIQWLFVPSTWWRIWNDSGKFEHRGTKAGQYVMARFDDKGPYAPWNVRITTCGENTNEMWLIRHAEVAQGMRETPHKARLIPKGPQTAECPSVDAHAI